MLGNERSRQRMTENNPMKRPEVAAKVAKATRQRWVDGLQAGSAKGLEAGRIWTDERRAAWAEKAKTSWTPAMREAARQKALAYQAKLKAALRDARIEP
jgi:hypothetical protein